MAPEPIPLRPSEVEPAPVDQRFRQEIDDAEELLRFAVSTGREVPEGTIQELSRAASVLATNGPITVDTRTNFHRAYAHLAAALAPVTIDSLRATDDTCGVRFLSRTRISIARAWSRKLTLLTLFVAAFILFGENVNRILLDEDLGQFTFGSWYSGWVVVAGILQSLVPFAYGTLGACAYLLRSCHVYIHKREFNPKFISEYFTRMLLGGVSGAAILLFTEAILNGDGAVKISASALAFVAGYSNDFLFNFIERVIAALMPKSPAASSATTEGTGPKATEE